MERYWSDTLQKYVTVPEEEKRMPTRVSKNGNRSVATEFEVRLIDGNGDCIDVNHYDEENEALTIASLLSSRIITGAVVVEKHISRRPHHLYREPDSYITILTFGSIDAIKLGGWTQDKAKGE